eukprot:TRINITY_DN51690_c0_g1_i1.p1 TRINITY_DN51690_c0_g1~~TRINITY_DN51690_c0_g1_i1.p1  ORF type:complete len:425 (-),score=144.46 TRINITY_DN51690_c0_g1_i1:53-1243(-)
MADSKQLKSKAGKGKCNDINAETAGCFEMVVQFCIMVMAKIAAMLREVIDRSFALSKTGAGSSKVDGTTLSSSKKQRAPRGSPPASGSKAKKGKAVAAVQEETAPPEYVEKERPETATERRIRTVRKKLLQIADLEERANAEETLTPEQLTKLAGKAELEQELHGLKQIAAVEAKEAAELAAAEAQAAAEKEAAAQAAEERRAAAKEAAEAALARKRREALEVLPNISPESEQVKNQPRLQALLKQVAELSTEVFHEDCLDGGVSKKKGWRLTLLARPVPEDPENAPPEDPETLLGFMVFRFRPDFQCLSIAKIAVPEVHRGRGFGKHLMEWCTKYAEKQNLQHLSLSSLPDAVKFYRAFGFKPVKVDSIRGDEDDLIEGQVYMEYRLKGGSGNKK